MVSAFPVIIMRIARRALQTFIGSYVWLSTKTRDCSITLYAPLETSGRRDTNHYLRIPLCRPRLPLSTSKWVLVVSRFENKVSKVAGIDSDALDMGWIVEFIEETEQKPGRHAA